MKTRARFSFRSFARRRLHGPHRRGRRARSKSVWHKLKGVESLVRFRRPRFRHANQQLQRGHHRGRHHSLGSAQGAQICSLTRCWRRTQRAFAQVPEAFTFAFGLPPILGLSTTGGFQFMLEDRAGGELDQLSKVADALVDAARKRPEIGNVISTFRASVPAYSINMDLDKLQTLGVPVTDAYNTLQTFLGGLYVNDFNRFSHTWQVLIQAEPEFRNQPSDIDRFYVRSEDGNMVPLGTLASIKPTTGPEVVFRYNRFRAMQILGAPAPGVSSGQAIDVMEKVAAQALPTATAMNGPEPPISKKWRKGTKA